MRILNHSLPLFALAYVSDALVQCDTKIHSVDHCRLPKRPTYVHVDDLAMDSSPLMVADYMGKLVVAGADYIILDGAVMGDGTEHRVTGSVAQYLMGQIQTDPPPLGDFMREKGAKLIMTVGGDPPDCDAISPTPQTSAEHWCQVANLMGFDGVNWNLDRLTKTKMDDQNVQWFINATEICRPYVDLIMYSVQGDRLSTNSPSPIDAIIEASRPNDRFLLLFRDVRGPLGSSYTKDAKAISQLLASMEARVPKSKGKLVVGKVLYGSACSRSVTPSDITDLMEYLENDGFTGGVVLSKAPAYGSNHVREFVKIFLPRVSRRRTTRTRRFLSAAADGSESLDASSQSSTADTSPTTAEELDVTSISEDPRQGAAPL